MGPLEGLKIADFSWVFAGPLITRTLADLGAQVVRIEGRTRPDGERLRHPYTGYVPGVNRATDFNHNNTSKLSLAVNLSHPRGVELAKRVVAWSDVVVENFAGGVIDRMGLGYAVLKQVKPEIIMLSACMQGHTGPHAQHPGYGHQLTALAGYHHIVGWPDRRPRHFSVYTDWTTVHFGVLAIMSAVDHRRRTGRGQYLDMSQYEVGVQFMSHLVLDYNVNGRVALRNGNRCDFAAPHGAFRCRDDEQERWCAIAVFSDRDWAAFRLAMEDPEWTADARFASLLGRKDNEDEMEKLIEAWTAKYGAEEVMDRMQVAGVPAGVVSTDQDLLDRDPQLRHSGFYVELEHEEVGRYRAPRPPFTLSKTSADVRAAPLLGEHNEYVCKDLLGMSDDEIADLVIEGALE